MIFIRTDANNVIATGHVMRCLSLANELRNFDENPVFILSDYESVRLIEESGYRFYVLNTRWDQLDNPEEYVKMRGIIGIGNTIIMDSYAVTPQYVQCMGEYANTVVFDDLCEYYYPADIVINHNIYYSKFLYSNHYNDKKTQLCLGGLYVPLRRQFRLKRSVKMRCKIERILLISGGGDPINFMGDFMEYISIQARDIFSNFRWEVVAGVYNQAIGRLCAYEEQNESIKVHKNVENMAELMQCCDLCISAAGTVLYECCACSLPTIFFCSADNQRYDGEYFSKDDTMLYAGDYRTKDKRVLAQVVEYVRLLTTNLSMRENMVQKMADLHVDGYGAERIARVVKGL